MELISCEKSIPY
jgi:hypothetical protein